MSRKVQVRFLGDKGGVIRLSYPTMSGKCKNLFPEIVRILKPGGKLTVIECKKEEMPFGPPLEMHISPEELEDALRGYGFRKQEYVNLGYYYMMLFEATKD